MVGNIVKLKIGTSLRLIYFMTIFHLCFYSIPFLDVTDKHLDDFIVSKISTRHNRSTPGDILLFAACGPDPFDLRRSDSREFSKPNVPLL